MIESWQTLRPLGEEALIKATSTQKYNFIFEWYCDFKQSLECLVCDYALRYRGIVRGKI